MKIRDIATITSGYAFRGAVKVVPNGSTRIVQISDISVNEIISDESKLVCVNGARLATRAYLIDGDVLLTARGTGSGGFKAAVYRGSHTDTIVPSSVYILRLSGRIIPEYVALYLNSYEGHSNLMAVASGSSIQTITKSDLGDIDIPILDTEKQKLLISLLQNVAKQKKLHEQIKIHVDAIINQTISSLLV